jgi:hypothetical protein
LLNGAFFAAGLAVEAQPAAMAPKSTVAAMTLTVLVLMPAFVRTARPFRWRNTRHPA